MTTTVGLHRPSVEIRRLRSEVMDLGRQLTELRRLVAEHLAADPGVVVTLATARAWAAEAYARGRADGIEADRLTVLAELKSAQHELHSRLKDSAPVWAMHFEALDVADLASRPRTAPTIHIMRAAALRRSA